MPLFRSLLAASLLVVGLAGAAAAQDAATPPIEREPAPAAPAAAPPATAPPATAPPAPVSSTPPTSANANTAPQTADETFNTRVKTIEEQVVDLKEKIFRTKARLLLLQETVLGGDLSTGARAVLLHRNEMGSSFVLESVAIALDGAPVFTKVDSNGDLAERDELEIFNGRIVPGQHQISVRHVYRGHGFGVFSYLEGYKFTVQSSYAFNAEAGKVTQVKVVGFEKGGFTADLKDKPAIRYDIDVAKDTGGGKTQVRSPAAPPTPAPTETQNSTENR